ncbi:MAG: tRNA(Ile)-lysidine synthetase [Vampirovibrio sp.]|jgi:tRNA(Ile)-lysidine synthase|nr:tRNA(Ile)-lysidine synthetase [Vampirovibrio sp.]
MILESVIENLQAEGLLQTAPRTHLVLGYSGGADSTALLYLLNDIRQKLPLDVTAAYFNHRWRDNPPEELPLVHQNCLATNTPLVIVQADLSVPKTETAARHARYKQLTGLANDLHADAVLTAHHADDQIETLLFRILRGTGIDGLSGIQKRLLLGKEHGSPVPVLRPLLDVSRKTIREYINEKQLTYFDDPTNLDSKRQRNHIRHNVLPVLEQNFPQVKNSLFRLTLVAEGDVHIIDETIEGIWQEVYAEDKTGPYLEALRFNQLGLPYQRRILRRFLIGQDIHADFQTIEDLLAFIRGEGRRNLDTSLKSMIKNEDGKGRFLSLYKNRLRLIDAPEKPAEPAAAVSVEIPGPVPVPALGVSFFALPWLAPEKVKMSPIRPSDSQQVFVDLTTFADKPLELRTRRPGDKFQPMGLDAPLRFKKFLINRGVPRFERDRLLVLAHGNQVLWVPGLGISQQLRLKEKAMPTHLLKILPGLQHEAPLPMFVPSETEEETPKIPEPEELSLPKPDEFETVVDEEFPSSPEEPTGVEP